MTETTPEDDLEPHFSSPRSKEIYEGLIGILTDLDDPLTLAEQWAERVARMQTSIERAKIVLGPLRRYFEEDENAIGLALLDGVVQELDAALPASSLSEAPADD